MLFTIYVQSYYNDVNRCAKGEQTISFICKPVYKNPHVACRVGSRGFKGVLLKSLRPGSLGPGVFA